MSQALSDAFRLFFNMAHFFGQSNPLNFGLVCFFLQRPEGGHNASEHAHRDGGLLVASTGLVGGPGSFRNFRALAVLLPSRRGIALPGDRFVVRVDIYVDPDSSCRVLGEVGAQTQPHRFPVVTEGVAVVVGEVCPAGLCVRTSDKPPFLLLEQERTCLSHHRRYSGRSRASPDRPPFTLPSVGIGGHGHRTGS